MVDYVEFPTDLLREIVLPQKQPPNPNGWPYPPDQPGPCGAYTWVDGVQFYPGIYSPQPFGLWFLHTATSSDVGLTLVWVHMPYRDVDGGVHPFVSPYLWQQPTQFVVTASTVPFAGGGAITVNLPFQLMVWNSSANVRSFNPCTDAPDFVLRGGPGPDTVEAIVPTDGMFVVAGGADMCTLAGVVIRVQANCPQETDDALPGQPPGWPQTDPRWAIEVIGPPLPGSFFLSGH